MHLNLLHKAEKLSVCSSVCPTIMPISQPCQHGLKRDLLTMKGESSGMTKYVFTSQHVPVFIHMSTQKALM